MSDEDDIVSALGLAEQPTPKAGQSVQKPDVLGSIEEGKKVVTRSAAEILGLPDAMKALRGEMTEDEAQHFALTAAMGLLPGAKMENALMKGASRLAAPGEGNALTGIARYVEHSANPTFEGMEQASNAFTGMQNVHAPQQIDDPLVQQFHNVVNQMDWEHAAPKTATPEGYSLKQVPGASSTPDAANDFYIHDPSGKKIGELTHTPHVQHDEAWSTPEHWHLSVDNQPDMAEKTYSTPQEALKYGQIFHEQALADKASGKYDPYAGVNSGLSDADIDKALAKNPGASIFDVAGTHVGGASSPYSPNPLTNSMLAQKGYGDVDAASIPRVGGVLSTPLAAKIMGRSENLLHGTRVSTDRWMTPEGGGEALALPEDELGVHFGNPRQAQVFTGSGLDNYSSPRTYPVVVQANNPLRMRDLGSWHEDRQFPQGELDNLDGMPAIRKYLNDKGYDSVVYQNSEEDRGHDSFIKFTPSPVDPQFVSGVRSPWAKFDPNKLSWPELAAGVPMAAGGAAAGTGLLFDQNNNPIVQTK